ncbi:MAG: hypothetical protein L0H84_12380 [Pseudonocardia sp.]|nr:hypothetical protein [Pseudonocardia sp.]
MTPTTHTTAPTPVEPLLRPLLGLLARARTEAGGRRRPGSADQARDARLPMRCGDSHRWPDGSWIHSG